MTTNYPESPNTPNSFNRPHPYSESANTDTASFGAPNESAPTGDLVKQQMDRYRPPPLPNTGQHVTGPPPPVMPAPPPPPPPGFPTPPKFAQPSSGGGRKMAATIPMSPKGAEIAARLKETFYQYTNRLERNAQTTLGPSEVGTPCDRRLALSLLQVPPCNPGGDNWASFVGTCVHVGLADMLEWANAGTGRYQVELSLTFPSVVVPAGTGDALDRTLCLFLDHKLMGEWSLNKLRTQGPSETYRIQVHLYAFGARLRGEKVRDVAIIGWPRQGRDLEDLYVWTEPYDASVAREALKRADRIGKAVKAAEGREPLEVAREFAIADDCRFCPFYLSGDKAGVTGCNGKE